MDHQLCIDMALVQPGNSDEFYSTSPNTMSFTSIMHEFAPSAFELCQGYLGGAWRKASFEDFTFKPVSGGMSNYLYLCELPSHLEAYADEPRRVLVRLYGQIMDFSARVYEGVVFSLLSERGFGPHLYGIFPSGRIEQYIPSRHLTVEELCDKKLSEAIAKQVASYHAMNLPLNMEPCFLWKKMKQYLRTISNMKLDAPKDIAIMAKVNTLDLESEYLALKKYIQSEESHVVFCHNDLQEGNILLLDDNPMPTIQMIDYEYSSYNYREFDFGNHFCESMYRYSLSGVPGFERTKEGYPTYEHQFSFIKTYLNAMSKLSGDDSVDVSDTAIHDLVVQSDKFSLISHFFWGLWSLIQNMSTCIEFGYMEYALVRLEDYKWMKNRLGLDFQT